MMANRLTFLTLVALLLGTSQTWAQGMHKSKNIRLFLYSYRIMSRWQPGQAMATSLGLSGRRLSTLATKAFGRTGAWAAWVRKPRRDPKSLATSLTQSSNCESSTHAPSQLGQDQPESLRAGFILRI